MMRANGAACPQVDFCHALSFIFIKDIQHDILWYDKFSCLLTYCIILHTQLLTHYSSHGNTRDTPSD